MMGYLGHGNSTTMGTGRQTVYGTLERMDENEAHRPLHYTVHHCIFFTAAVALIGMAVFMAIPISYQQTTASYLMLSRGAINKKSVLLLRHAKSSWDDHTLDDFDRPLALEGAMDAERLGIYLNKKQVMPPDIIYASPSVRTRATLELVAQHWKALAAVPVRFDEELYDFEDEGTAYRDFVRDLDSAYQRVMIVGHNPQMLLLEQQLTSHPIKKYPPATFCELSFHADTWKRTHDGEIVLCAGAVSPAND
jgi:phosphohistidine phosphatase